MPKSTNLLIVLAVVAAVLLGALGIVFAAPGGTVILDPLTATRFGLPGTTVTHTLGITNSGGTATITDTFVLTYTGNQWLVELSVTEISLPGDASANFVVSVTVPSTATTTSDTVTITVYHQGSPQLPSSRLTTRFFQIYMPIIMRAYGTQPDVCRPVEGESYGSQEIPNWATTPPAETHPDLNLALPGYTPTNALLGLVDLGDTRLDGPQLAGLFATPRQPNFTAAYRVNNWDDNCHCPGKPIEEWDVTLIDLAATPGETVHVPDRADGYIGGDYKALVLYASQERLTLKYTSEDSIVIGYAIYLENICVDPTLLALYQTLNSADRHSLPALRAGQAIGRARSDHIGVAVRDTGAFMDPRSHYDWWRGY